MTTVKAIKCPKCGYTIFSRARHDYRSCSCKAASIDGEFDYVKINFPTDIEIPKIFELRIEQTPKELYDDWNSRREDFGLIPPKKEERDETS